LFTRPLHLAPRDLVLATHLRQLSALHLHLQPGPFHSEHPLPGGAVGAAGAAALARGLPGLASLGLVGCRVAREALALLISGLTALQSLDLSGAAGGGGGGGGGGGVGGGVPPPRLAWLAPVWRRAACFERGRVVPASWRKPGQHLQPHSSLDLCI
jgi:hypothetical protein